uniref:Uncharacterized protein n=1 Tax=Globodera rostochiensis TaxID=31243 RepID=A0A914HR73_GLORO
MSAPIQQKLGAALKILSNVSSAVKLNLQPDKNLSNLENALLLESQLEKVQKEGRTLEIFLEDIRESSSAWTDLLRKFTATERDAGEADFAAFDKKEKINDKPSEQQTAKELLEQHGKIPMKDWAAKEQQITAELLEQEEKRHKKSRDKQQKRSKQQASEQLMLQRLFGDSPEQAPEQTTTTEAEDKESRFQHNEKRIKWYNHRQAAVDELRRKMKLKKKQQAPAAIEEDINEPRKEDEQHLQKLIKDGSKEAQRALEASKQLTLRQQSQQRMHHKPQRRASDLPKNGEKLIDFGKRLYGDHLESAWKRQRAFKEMQEILESNEFKLYQVNGQQATIKCFLANQHGLGGIFVINRFESFNHPDEFEFRTALSASKEATERPEAPEIMIVSPPKQSAPRPTTSLAGRAPPRPASPDIVNGSRKGVKNKDSMSKTNHYALKRTTLPPTKKKHSPHSTYSGNAALTTRLVPNQQSTVHRYQPNPYETWQLHEDYALLDGPMQREAAEHFWTHQVINQKRPLFKPATLFTTIDHWRKSCDQFAELFQPPSMAPIKFKPIINTQTSSPFQVWLDEINNHASDKASQIKAKIHFPKSRYLNNSETIVIGESIAEAFSHSMRNAFWFSHAVKNPLRVFFGPRVRRLVFAYDADVENIVQYLAPIIHPLSKTDIGMTIILGKEDNLDWLQNKRNILSLAQSFKIGFFVFNGKPGELLAISERIQGQQVEDMDLDPTPSTSALSNSSRPNPTPKKRSSGQMTHRGGPTDEPDQKKGRRGHPLRTRLPSGMSELPSDDQII